ncbi:hypothetical protein [Alcanivorax borkumensis]|uniref:Uncharacterized protein n=1 Tax=Alcanivorax borkumensis (strain ATCC 700651 / DSM 11573 / NCIMB 13689 / SK2) TaxID=393595 RepID=Q0VP45_ALCBS|nr:hypothetical protein [Alcanivorax borkumensis]CAL17053.1 hypothetical protein ABO_1605 [Alcanivorax borkumensis SK2]
MSNWFQEHPIFTIIGHTALVATTTIVFTTFVLDENKINFYKAQSESATAQINNEKAVAEQYKAKISVLESDITALRSDNERYLKWLGQDPKSFPSLEQEIKNLNAKLKDAALASIAKSSNDSKSNTSPITSPAEASPLPYQFSSEFLRGSSFVDPKTRATIGVSDISPKFTATGVLSIPGKGNLDLSGVKPGSSWSFSENGINYKLTLEGVNWINNTLKASVVEMPASK